MRVLMTGGYGFIGAWIAKSLLKRGDSVFVYDLRENLNRHRLIMNDDDIRKIKFVSGDVCELATLDQAIKNNSITHILHLAGLQVPTCKTDPILGAKVNVLGTLACFEAARLNKLESVVYASSAAVFGDPAKYPAGPQPDDSPLIPSTHYGVFKCCNEGNARIYFQDHGIASVGLRPWTVYGPGRDLGMTSDPTKAIKAAMLGRKFHINFGGWTDFQYVSDTAETFVNCLHRPYQGAKSYNCRGVVTTVAEFHKTLAKVLPAAEKLVTYGTSQIGICYDLSDDGLQKDLGSMQKTSLEDGIRETLGIFIKLHSEGRLDTSELEDVKPVAKATVLDEA